MLLFHGDITDPATSLRIKGGNIPTNILTFAVEIILMKNMQGMDKVTQIVVMNRELMDAIIVGNITIDQIPVDTTINLGVPIANN